jgi:hypothetical protein
MIFIGLGIQAQSPFQLIKKHYLLKTNFWIRGSVITVAGASDGWAEALRYHYAGFKDVFPHANDQFWDPQKCWVNKYKNGDVKQGPKFPGSTTCFVGLTDGYHLMRTIRNTGVAASIVIPLGNKDKKKWFEYLFEIGSSSIFYLAGYNSTYNSLFGR